jgi:hypothetical protein
MVAGRIYRRFRRCRYCFKRTEEHSYQPTHSTSLNIITQGLEATMDISVRQIGENVYN